MGRLLRVWPVVVVATLLMGASCQTPKVVKIDGRDYKPAPREYQLWEQAKAARQSSDLARERTSLQQLLRDFPSTAYARKARLRLGVIDYRRSKWTEASSLFAQSLRGSWLKPEERNNVLWMYGHSLYKQQRYEKSLQVLEEVYPRLSAAQQKRARPLLVSAATQTNNARALVHWQAASLADVGPERRQQLKQQLSASIDGRMSLAQLKKLYARRGERLRFPFDLVALRLARSYFHQGQYQRAQSVVKTLIGELARSHSLYPQAMRMQRQLSALLDSVRIKTIGVIYPRSGWGAGLGRRIRNAIELARGGIRNINVIYMDSGSNRAKAAKAVETLVFKHRVIAIFGPVLPGVSRAAALRAQRLGVPLFSISFEDGLPQIGPYVFRNNITLSQMGRAMARYAVKRLSLRKFAAFYRESGSGRTQVRAFWKEVERLGGTMVGVESYPPGTMNFEKYTQRLVGRYHLTQRPLWGRLASGLRGVRGVQRSRLYKKLVKQFPPVLDFDAIFIPDNYRIFSLIAPSLALQDVEVKAHYAFWERQIQRLYRQKGRQLKFIQLLGTNGLYDDRIFRREPRRAMGTIFCLRYYAESRSVLVKNFVRRYRSYLSSRGQPVRTPIHVDAYTYDTVRMLLDVMKGPNAPKTRAAFRQKLSQIRNFPGVTGRITINRSGAALAPIHYLMISRSKSGDYTFRLRETSKELIP